MDRLQCQFIHVKETDDCQVDKVLTHILGQGRLALWESPGDMDPDQATLQMSTRRGSALVMPSGGTVTP